MSRDYRQALQICTLHEQRLRWAMDQLRPLLPFTPGVLDRLTEMQMAILDQFLSRYSRLQDVMGIRLFPAVLELTKELVASEAFIDKLNRFGEDRGHRIGRAVAAPAGHA